MKTYITDSISCTELWVGVEIQPNRKDYEEDLARRRQEHLDSIQSQDDMNWSPCMHDSCPECVGTGIKRSGGMCVHMISCPCLKCTPRY